MFFVLNTFDVLPCGSTFDEINNLSSVILSEELVDPFSSESLFELQFNLCSSSAMGISMNMRWDDAGQLPLKDGIRILETLTRKNEELADAIKNN